MGKRTGDRLPYDNRGGETVSEFRRQVLALADAGFLIGQRDARLNQAFKGRYMVVIADYSEQPEYMPSLGAENIPCIVGDDLAELVADAYANFCPNT